MYGLSSSCCIFAEFGVVVGLCFDVVLNMSIERNMIQRLVPTAPYFDTCRTNKAANLKSGRGATILSWKAGPRGADLMLTGLSARTIRTIEWFFQHQNICGLVHRYNRDCVAIIRNPDLLIRVLRSSVISVQACRICPESQALRCAK